MLLAVASLKSWLSVVVCTIRVLRASSSSFVVVAVVVVVLECEPLLVPDETRDGTSYVEMNTRHS